MSFLVLVFAHLLADYPLQGDFLAKMKGKNYIILATHAAIWTGTVSIATYLLGFNITLFDISWLFIIHAAADYLKARRVGIYKNLDPLKGGLILDQSIHIVQLFALMSYKGMM